MDDSEPTTTSVDSVADTLPASPIVPSDVLLPMLVEATAALRTVAPLLLPCRVLAYRDSLPPGLSGAYVALIGGIDSVYLGVLSDPTSAVSIARRLTVDAEGLDELKVRSAMCRVTRKLAHGLKRRIRSTRSVTVTEPVFVSGIVQPSGEHALRAAEVVLGVVRATLVVVARSGAPSKGGSESPAGQGGPRDEV
jgi:hypothetical protein